QRALAAQTKGFLAAELVPLAGLTADTGPRASLTPALLARFPAAFVQQGTVTAGNSCPDADGAAVVLVLSRAKAVDLGFTEGLVMVDSATAGCPPDELGVGAAASTEALRRRLGVDAQQPLAEQFPLIEFNEAFAAQVLAVADQLGLSPTDFNNDGGSLALGHPYGASGAVLVTRLLARARRANREVAALAMISMAGGMGISTAFNWQELA
ncbi:MAG: acetyl-CoA C-acyltransferase, partial [Acidobacteria bacterium]|nr:acetyl-CoA C-acyltransferase [Acidobacteriota bacterium]